jgi:hypothetical protein
MDTCEASCAYQNYEPAWQDLAEGWGEATKLQIPRFARDDNSENDDNGKGRDDNNNGTAEATQSNISSGKAEPVPIQSKTKTA